MAEISLKGAEESNHNRQNELKAFDETKSGVKGLVGSGLSKIPTIFIDEQYKLERNNSNIHNQKPRSSTNDEGIPTINLTDVDEDPNSRREIVKKVGEACEKWGFFQVIKHGIPLTTLDETIDGIRRFHEQENEAKKEIYSRDYTRSVNYNSNFDLYFSETANWRDTLTCVMAPRQPLPQELPAVCRDIMIEYSNKVMKLGNTLLGLLSEPLGLNRSYLEDIGCAEGLFVVGHYYPACPEPDFTLISNDKFKSVHHRVLANTRGPRISIASFFRTHLPPENASRLYGPIKELTSEETLHFIRKQLSKTLCQGTTQKGLIALHFNN